MIADGGLRCGGGFSPPPERAGGFRGLARRALARTEARSQAELTQLMSGGARERRVPEVS